MRIVGGVYKGRKLIEFDGYDIRPTSDSARESLFNILRNRISGASFLDLFCGTGAVGIEAKSRGAGKVVLNDLSKKSISVAKSNLEKLGNPPDISVVSSDAVSFLNSTALKFDIIFIDAPYKSECGINALNLAERTLAENGIVIFENEKPFDGTANNLTVYDERRYGRAHLTFFKRGENV